VAALILVAGAYVWGTYSHNKNTSPQCETGESVYYKDAYREMTRRICAEEKQYQQFVDQQRGAADATRDFYKKK
jgi:hypothetical protein